MQYDSIMQDIAFYDMGGLLSQDVRETVCNIVCSIEPSVNMIDYIDIDGIIQAVDERGATELEDAYDVRFSNQFKDWYVVEECEDDEGDGWVDVYRYRKYLNIGPCTKTQACSYLARLHCDNACVEITAFPDYRNNSTIRNVIVKSVLDDIVVENYQL